MDVGYLRAVYVLVEKHRHREALEYSMCPRMKWSERAPVSLNAVYASLSGFGVFLVNLVGLVLLFVC